MKQTQTKMFDFSDVGLDFCAGSKSLFPDRFKKLLALGYNEQIVASVTILGNQVTLNYGVSHGYVADRVLKIKTGLLSIINDGEFWIDSVTTNTVTMTIDDAPTNIEGNFKTVVAPLGWELVYELNHIHIYKFKNIDDTDMFLRLCFQNNLTARNTISPCIGVNFDPASGEIIDPLANANKNTSSSLSDFRWDFTITANSTYNNYNYNQGYSIFGRSAVIGSQYHCLFMSHAGNNNYTPRLNGFVPIISQFKIQPVLLIGEENNVSTSNASTFNASFVRFLSGTYNLRCQVSTSTSAIFEEAQASTMFLPSEIEEFNTSTAEPIPLYTTSGQHLGYALGIFRCKFASDYVNTSIRTSVPNTEYDIDYNPYVLHLLGLSETTSSNRTGANSIYYAVPIEEIKID